MNATASLYIITLMISCVLAGFILGIIFSEKRNSDRKKGDKDEKHPWDDKQ